MRAVIRVEALSNVSPSLGTFKGHLKIIHGACIMRTHTVSMQAQPDPIVLCEDRESNLPAAVRVRETFYSFAVHVPNEHARLNEKVKFQLRQNRMMIRSKNVGVGYLPLSLCEKGRMLVATIPIVSEENVTVGKLLLSVQLEDSQSLPPLLSSSFAMNGRSLLMDTSMRDDGEDGSHSIDDRQSVVVVEPPAVVPPSPTLAPRSMVSAPVAPQVRHVGTQYYGPPSWTAQDHQALGLTDLMKIGESEWDAEYVARQGVADVSSFRTIALPKDLTNKKLEMPVGLQALKALTPAWPEDEVQGLLLYTQRLEMEVVELRSQLQRFHTKRILNGAAVLSNPTRVAAESERSRPPPPPPSAIPGVPLQLYDTL